MLVDQEGVFMTQRTDTRLALFRTAIEPDGLKVVAPSGEVCMAPLEPEGVNRSVRVWKDMCVAIQVSTLIDEWLSEILGRPCSLVYMPEGSLRHTNPAYTSPGDIVGFADAYPVLVASEESLADLNSRMEVPLPMNRFRANIIVSGCEPFEEDTWPNIQIGDVRFRAVKKCGRCQVTTTDQDTAETGVEPLRTLATYRKEGSNVMFGAYFVPETIGCIRVGDEVIIQSFQGPSSIAQ